MYNSLLLQLRSEVPSAREAQKEITPGNEWHRKEHSQEALNKLQAYYKLN